MKYAENPATQLLPDGQPVGDDYVQETIMGQVATPSSTTSTPASSSCRSSTGLILILAANTAFNGFPVLGSILAKDG